MSLPLFKARRYADHIVEWMVPFCERIEIAGSIRRERPNCNDVDIVCIPKREAINDLLGQTGERNVLWEFLFNYVADGKATFTSGGKEPGKFAILQLAKCQLDVYFASVETFATRFVSRTGSKEHNIWIAERARQRFMEWKPYEGLFKEGRLLHCESETEFYQLLELPFIEPAQREFKTLIDKFGL